MASPDFSTYVDLTPYDSTVTSILDEGIEQARALLPQWTPRAGQTETTMMEAVAYQTANLVNAANRLPGSTVETLLKLFGVTRSNGVKSTATATINFTDTKGYTIPATTAFAHYGTDGSVYVYLLDADAEVAEGSNQLTLRAITAQVVGASYNTPSNGATLQVLSTIPYISSVVFDAKPSGGLDAETDTEYFTRGIGILQSYSSVLATEDQIRSFILTNYSNSAYRVKAYNMRRYADRNIVTFGGTSNTGGKHKGYVLVSVAGQNVNDYSQSINDATVSAADISTFSTAIASKVASGITIEIHNAELIGIGITAEVYKVSTAAAGTVQTAIQTALKGYLDSDAWDWGEVVRVNEIISLLDKVTDVDYVKSVTLTLPEETVVASTTADLGTVTYDNGTLGVGATLTNGGSQAAFSVDGQSPTVNSRILVKDQSSALQNGIYTLTTVGDGSTNWVLTRAVDADTTTEMVVNKFVWVTAGSTNGSKGFACSASGTIGTDSVSFTQTTTATRAEVLSGNSTLGDGGLTGDIRLAHLGMLTYPSTLTITVS